MLEPDDLLDEDEAAPAPRGIPLPNGIIINVNPEPAYSRERSIAEPVWNVTHGELSAEQQANLQRAAGLPDQQIEVERRAGESAARKARIEEARAAAIEQDRASLAAELNRIDDETGQEIAQAHAQNRAAVDQYRGASFHDYWANRSTGDKILAAISVAMGGLSATIRGGPNYALQIINKAVDDDFAMQRDRIGKMKDDVLMARTGLSDAKQARRDLVEALGQRQTAALEAIGATYETQLRRLGVPDALIAQDKNIAAINAAAVDRNAKLLAETTRHIEEKGEERKQNTKITRAAPPPGRTGGMAYSAEGEPIAAGVSEPAKLNTATKKAADLVAAVDALIAHKRTEGAVGYVPIGEGLALSDAARERKRLNSVVGDAVLGFSATQRWSKEKLKAALESAGITDLMTMTGGGIGELERFKREVVNSLGREFGTRGISARTGRKAIGKPAASPVSVTTDLERARLMKILRENPDPSTAARVRALLERR